MVYSNKLSAQAAIIAKSPNKLFINHCQTILTGYSNLTNGSVYFELPQKLREDLIGRKYVVNLSPYESWSALYVKEINEKGFTVKSESGDLNAKFFWSITAVPSITETN